MTTFLLMLAAGLAAQGDANAAGAQTRKCAYKAERVAAAGPARYRQGKGDPMHLRAVETRINGCAVLTDAGSGRMIEPPVFDGRDAKVIPAR